MTAKRGDTKPKAGAGRRAPAAAPSTPQALSPATIPPALGASHLEMFPSPFRVLRVTLRHFEYQEVAQTPNHPPPPALGEALNTAAELRAAVTLFVEGAEVGLDVQLTPDAARMPVVVRAAFSALVARPEGMPDEQFVPLMGEIGPRLLLPYVRQAVTQMTALGLYGPLHVDLMNVRVVWEPAGGN